MIDALCKKTGEDVLLLNKPRAYEVMDKYGLDGLLDKLRKYTEDN